MNIAVVIPALDEEAVLPGTLAHTAALGFDRILVVDGGSGDHTRELVERLADLQPSAPGPQASLLIPLSPSDTRLPPPGCITPITLLTSPPGRARQMNAGAATSKEDILLFLHADTRLPSNARAEIQRALEDPACVGGRFDVRFERAGGWSRTIGRLMNLRSRWSGIATGDQAIFVRRAIFERMGGFADLPLMEDIEFTRRLKRMGRIAALRAMVATSFRRWETGGTLATVVLMWGLRLLFWAGVSPHRLTQYYRAVR